VARGTAEANRNQARHNCRAPRKDAEGRVGDCEKNGSSLKAYVKTGCWSGGEFGRGKLLSNGQRFQITGRYFKGKRGGEPVTSGVAIEEGLLKTIRKSLPLWRIGKLKKHKVRCLACQAGKES